MTEHDRKEVEAFALFLRAYTEAVNLGISKAHALEDAELEAYGPDGCAA